MPIEFTVIEYGDVRCDVCGFRLGKSALRQLFGVGQSKVLREMYAETIAMAGWRIDKNNKTTCIACVESGK